MCGITAALTLAGRQEGQALDDHTNLHGSYDHSVDGASRREKLDLELSQSLEAIQHRGPDTSGKWISHDGLIALGNVRLQINDLTPTGNQPFQNSSRTITAVVNGEIYNHEDLRADICQKTDYKFQGRSDCESVLALYEYYGLSFLSMLNGEYALCIYDSEKKTLIAARDRSGVKPLVWTVDNGRLLITSEAKALLPFGWKPAWDVRSLKDSGWNTEERTIFQGLRKVPPGCYLTCNAFNQFDIRRYWDLEFPDKCNVEKRDEKDMIDGFSKRLLEAVRIRLQADVPVGIYLSGGIDSSVIAGIAKHLLDTGQAKLGSKGESHKLTCLGVAFAEGSEYDESAIAERTAKRLDVSFHKVIVNEDDFAKDFEAATWSNEQHYFDLGFVAKHALSRFTRDFGLKVVLNGQGADEFLGGYTTYERDFLTETDLSWPHSELDEETRLEMLTKVESTLPKPVMDYTPAPAYTLVQSRIPFADWTKTYGHCDTQLTLAKNVDERVCKLMRSRWHPLNSALYTWYKCHLPNLLLTCIGDRTEMSNSIEGRTPFLDHNLVEYANGIPPSLKIKYNRKTDRLVEKSILREASKPFVSDELYQRKKHPYSSPVVHPIDGPLHRLLSGLITPENVEALGFIDWDQMDSMVDSAFRSQDKQLMGVVFVVAQWVVLSKGFGVARATEPTSTMTATDSNVSSWDQGIPYVNAVA